MVNQRFNKVEANNTQPAISSKNGVYLEWTCRSPENFNIFTGRPTYLTVLTFLEK